VTEQVGRLAGVRVLVTRPKERAEALCFLLEDEGAEVLALPLLELLPPEDPRPLRSAVEHVGRYAWVAFASPSAVQAVVEAAREAGTLSSLSRVRLAAVGPSTARALEDHGFTGVRTASRPTGEGLFDALKDALSPGDEVLLPVPEEGRRELWESLLEAGVQVTRVVAYRAAKSGVPVEALGRLREAPPQVIVFGSPRTAEAFVDVLGEEAHLLSERAKLLAIGPTTAAALERLGFRVARVALHPTSEALVEAAITAWHE